MPAVTVVRIDGRQLPVEILDRVVDVEVIRRLNEIGSCRVRIIDDELELESEYQLGTSLEVRTTYSDDIEFGEEHTLFSGEITGITRELLSDRTAHHVIDAHDLAHRLRRTIDPMTFENYDDQRAITDLLKNSGLTAKLEMPRVERPYRMTLTTPLDAVSELCRRNGCNWFVDGKEFHVRPIHKPRQGPTDLSWGDQLRRFDAKLSTVGRIKSVQTRSWDSAEQKSIIGKSKPAERAVSTPSATDDDKLAANTWRSPGVLNGSSGLPVSQKDADALAQAELNLATVDQIRGRGEAMGPLKPTVLGSELNLKDIGNDWSGKYAVTGLEYRLSQSEWRTIFTVGATTDVHLGDLTLGPTTSPTAISPGLTIGKVTNQSHPDEFPGEIRVRVKLPSVSGEELESNWARLLGAGAGAGRGQLIVPEIDDEVVVAFENGDIHRPIVIGSLWSPKAKAPESAKQMVKDRKVVRREEKSRNGHLIAFNDVDHDESGIVVQSAEEMKVVMEKKKLLIDSNKKELTIVGGGGSKIVIDKDGNIELTGNKVTINSDADFMLTSKKKVTVEAMGAAAVDGKGKVTIAGKQGVDIDAMPSNTVIKGLSVDVN